MPDIPSGHPNGQPNILFVMADQLAAPLLKMYNSKSQIKTPHLDALAARSVQFDSAYCPSPLCAPSRMSLMTGLLPSKIGAWDNAAQLHSEVPTFAHYLRAAGYHTVLAGKMHFIGEQLHGFEDRLTADIYPGDFGWVVDWDNPDTRLEWYHNASSILQAGTCVRSNQLDYDEEVMYKSEQFLYNYARQPPGKRPFCLTVSLTHPHDPYTIEQKYWDLYEDVDIALPQVRIPNEQQDPHSQRLLKVCDLWDQKFSDEQIRRARRAYYGAVSYVDDCIGKLLNVLDKCRLAQDTIVVFSGDHGDMLGERNLWYKMSYFENSVRVPLLVHHPRDSRFCEHRRVKTNVTTMDLLPTLCELAGTTPAADLPMDGRSFLKAMEGREDQLAPVSGMAAGDINAIVAEYMGEGTVRPLMMIKRGAFNYITCPADPPMLFDLDRDPLEQVNLAAYFADNKENHVEMAGPCNGTNDDDDDSSSSSSRLPLNDAAYRKQVRTMLDDFEAEAKARWDMDEITLRVLLSQRSRRTVWAALKRGRFTSWDHNPNDDGRDKYIRSYKPLDDLERFARFPPVDELGRETNSLASVPAESSNSKS